jgi:hypothetical protein
MTDPLPMLTLFDRQIQLRIGQANVRRWVDDLLPLLGDGDPRGVSLGHLLPLEALRTPTRVPRRSRTAW